MVHILAEDARTYYDLEGLWSQAEVIRLTEEQLAEAADDEDVLTGEE